MTVREQVARMSRISIVVPCYNERDCLPELLREVREVMDEAGADFECVFVDDGSTDDTMAVLRELKALEPRVKVVRLRKNFGQSTALHEGFRHSAGDIVASMDGDLQNDPRDILRMVKVLDEGCDVVTGWRRNRKDSWLKRGISHGAYLLRRLLFKWNVRDAGCTLRVYRRECLHELELYGEMHRVLVLELMRLGFNVKEIEVNHRPRKFGRTKYGLGRVVRGFLDLSLQYFWVTFGHRPMHFFGTTGMAALALGFACLVGSLYLYIWKHMDMSSTFLPTLGFLLVMIGVQLFTFGVLADIMMRLHRRSVGQRTVREVL
jgi:glycosyltransferase involved in cell wall biosynthesis